VCTVQVVEWFDLLGWAREPGLVEMARKDVMCGDGVVHLTTKRILLLPSLCCRIGEVELFVKSTESAKTRRTE
jgi:hypothetical protein